MIPLMRKLEKQKEAGDKAKLHDFLIITLYTQVTQSERYLMINDTQDYKVDKENGC